MNTHLHTSIRYWLWVLIGCLGYTVQAQQLASTHQLPSHVTAASSQKEMDQKTLKTVLIELEVQYQVSIVFDSQEIGGQLVETQPGTTQDIDHSLSALLKPFGLFYQKINQDVYVVRKKENKLEKLRSSTTSSDLSQPIHSLNLTSQLSASLPSVAKAYEREISGAVTDEETGTALPGVNVLVKETSIGTVTDIEGNYRLSVPDDAETLVFSSIGYVSQEMPIGDNSTINISLLTDVQSLDEIVVVGYGTQKKKDLTGSVSSVKSEELMDRPATNVEQSLAGRMSGVNVSTNSGRPGGRTRIRIRGFSSINATNDPLYVVDGIIWTAGIQTINPNDIESVDVLKDASATAIYGTRGANGVILINTKRGNKGGGSVSYDGWVSVNQLARKQDVLNSEQFLAIEEQAYQNAAKYDPEGFADGKYKDPLLKRQQYIGTLFDENLNPLYDVDWQDEATRTSVSQSHNLSFVGSDELSNYGLFLGYTRDNGIIKTSYQNRYSVRGVMDRQMKDWLKVGGTISYSVTQEQRADESTGANNVPRQMIEMVTFIPYQYPDGTYGYRGDYEGLEEGDNPLAQLYEDVRQFKSNVFSGNAYVNVGILEGLDFTTTLGVNLVNETRPRFNSNLSSRSGLGKNEAEIFAREDNFVQWINRLNYNREIAPGHTLNALLGIEYQKFNRLDWTARTNLMPDDYYEWYNLGAGSNPAAPTSGSTDWTMASYFARANYSLYDKYLITATGRFDGSSRFGADNKFAFFPSAALAWRISEEGFLQDNTTISNLKLRLSYGLTGNSQIGEYRSLANLGTTSYVFGGNRAAGTVIDRLANPELQWEKTAQYDVGFDLGLLTNLITLEADFFVKDTRDLLLEAPVPSTSGYTVLTRNIGSMRNTGVEVSINSINVQAGRFNWSTNFNFSWLKNEITALGVNNEDIYMFPNFLDRTNILRVGESVSSFYGYVREGTWNTNEEAAAAEYGKMPGDLKFADLNEDGEINAEDRTIIGKGIPDFYGTFANTIRFGNFDLLIDLQYSYGNDVFNLSEHSSEDRVGIANSYATVLNAWTPDNQDTPIAEWRPTAAGYDSKLDSHKVQDGSFIRGRNLSLGYNFGETLTSKIGVNSLRVYASAQNFFLITQYTGYDPEVTTWDDTFAQGMQFHIYPKARTLTLGLNVNF